MPVANSTSALRLTTSRRISSSLGCRNRNTTSLIGFPLCSMEMITKSGQFTVATIANEHYLETVQWGNPTFQLLFLLCQSLVSWRLKAVGSRTQTDLGIASLPVKKHIAAASCAPGTYRFSLYRPAKDARARLGKSNSLLFCICRSPKSDRTASRKVNSKS